MRNPTEPQFGAILWCSERRNDWDDESSQYGDVPPLAEQLRKAEEATRIDPPQPIGGDAPQWLKDAIERWKQEDS